MAALPAAADDSDVGVALAANANVRAETLVTHAWAPATRRDATVMAESRLHDIATYLAGAPAGYIEAIERVAEGVAGPTAGLSHF